MSRTLTLTPAPSAPAPRLAEPPRARLATWSAPAVPPVVEEFADADAAALVEAVCDAVAERSPVPVPAVREVVENLVHAGFCDAVVTVIDGGRTVRVSDHGPGIADPFLGYVQQPRSTPDDPAPTGGLGLWAARQLCDTLDYRASADGFTVRLVAHE
jgi:hypothetical protein